MLHFKKQQKKWCVLASNASLKKYYTAPEEINTIMFFFSFSVHFSGDSAKVINLKMKLIFLILLLQLPLSVKANGVSESILQKKTNKSSCIAEENILYSA